MDDQPNVLIVLTDQQSAWTVGAYGGTVVATPHIDAIAAEGARFDAFFTNSAVCSPSRGCFFTGLYPHVHGTYHNDIELNRDAVTFARVLQDHGYETGYAGKWHLDGHKRRPGWMTPDRSMGFADCRWMFECSHAKGVIESEDGPPTLSPDPAAGRFMTDWLADKAIDFLERDRSRPFCYVVGIPDPHEPYSVREPWASRFRPEDVPMPATFDEPTLPHWARHDLEGCGTWHDRDDPEDAYRRAMAAYCGEVACIDENVGRLLACLRERGILDKTVVVFTTDHGDYMGRHGLCGKNRVYEDVYRIPLLIRWPERIAAGTVVDRFVTTVDFQQTLLGLLGVPAAGAEQGRDASPFLRGEITEWTDEAYFHHSHFDFTGLFTPAYELGLASGGEHVLFDRVNDPDQRVNLYHDADRRETVASMTGKVVAHNRLLASPAMAWLAALV